jgi:acyl-CoA reductase-like NAD-dependent aldehyde dehydrogenase
MIKRFVVRNLDSACYKVVEGAAQVAIRMTNTKFDQIMYTGSTQKGKLVAEAAAKNLVPCLLELGGKCPMIVDKGCDVEYAAWKAAFGAFVNSG